jgi:hypothetical protein
VAPDCNYCSEYDAGEENAALDEGLKRSAAAVDNLLVLEALKHCLRMVIEIARGEEKN